MVSDRRLMEVEGPEAMHHLGERLARLLQPGDVLLLHGDLGAGKTTLTQGVLLGLGVTTPVTSPTFVLVSEYSGATTSGEAVAIRHVDLYRLNEPGELDSLGYSDLIDDPHTVTIIEWPERAGDELPATYILLTFAFSGPGSRVVELRVEPETTRFEGIVL